MRTLDLSTDFERVVDGLEPVTLRTPGTSGFCRVPKALRRAISTREAAASGGKYTASDVVWHMPKRLVDERPVLGSTIEDGDGGVWTVLEVQLQTLGTRWRCVCRDLAVAHGLNTSVTIQRRRYFKGDGGAAAWTWEDVEVGLRAKIQRESGGGVVEHSQSKRSETANIYTTRMVEVDASYRVVAADGTAWNVTGFTQPESITGLFTITAERKATA